MLRTKKGLIQTIVAMSVALAATNSMAAGFQLNAQSATGIGRAFAGDAVIADNAAAMARNPAAMALFDRPSLSLGFEIIDSMIEVSNGQYVKFGAPVVASNYDDAGGISVAPNIHYILPINDKFAIGTNLYSNFGTKTDFDDSFVAKESGGLTKLTTVNFGLASSYRLNKNFSLGAGVDFIYGSGTMKRNIQIVQDMKVLNIEDASGWAAGFNFGAIYEDENNRFGLSYRYSPNVKVADKFDQVIAISLPNSIEFAGYSKIHNTALAIHYSVQHTSWSDFKTIKFSNLSSGLIKDDYESIYNWHDSWRFALGTTYYLDYDWTMRAGYMYDTIAQDKIASVSVPDANRQWLSTGITYHINDNSNIDLGLTYLIGSKVHTKEVTEVGGMTVSSLTASVKSDAILFGMQYSYTF